MSLPLSLEAGLRETPLPVERPVFLRVFRVSVALALPVGGGVWAMAVPVAVVDRADPSAERTHVVIDTSLALGPAVVAVAALRLLFGALRRRRSREGRRR